METDRPRARGAVPSAVWILSLAVLFGIAAAWIKGNDAGLRDAIGNASAPWLLLPFLAGAAWRSQRLTGAAMAGLAATLAALAGFYFADSFVLQLGPHPWLADLSLTMRGAIFWAERAVGYPVPAYPALWLTEIALGITGPVMLGRQARQDQRAA